MTVETTNLQYWMQWQVFLCAEWILLALVLASVMILKFDVSNKVRRQGEDSTQHADASWYADESWKPCLREINPVILLLYRVVAFCLMVTVLVADITLEGWTFTLLMIYFGLGSLFFMYGCRISLKKLGSDDAGCLKVDDESGSSVCLANGISQNATATNKNTERHFMKRLGVGVISFRLYFSAGAVVLTDCVYWLVIFPFLTEKDYNLNFLMVTMHSINVVLLFIDTWLNRMRFLWCHIAYFILWTCIYVIFQWILHACTSSGWPYPFLDLSSQWAPLWYLFVGLMHIPCYAVFALMIKARHFFLSRWFPRSYECYK